MILSHSPQPLSPTELSTYCVCASGSNRIVAKLPLRKQTCMPWAGVKSASSAHTHTQLSVISNQKVHLLSIESLTIACGVSISRNNVSIQLVSSVFGFSLYPIRCNFIDFNWLMSSSAAKAKLTIFPCAAQGNNPVM